MFSNTKKLEAYDWKGGQGIYTVQCSEGLPCGKVSFECTEYLNS